MDLADDLIVRLNLASGFRAPNLAELTSNGVHEGTNRYEIGKDLKTEQNVQSDINLEYNNSHFEFFVNGFIIISITIFILHLQEGFKIIMMCSAISKTMLSCMEEKWAAFPSTSFRWLHYETSFETVTGKTERGLFAADSS
jgi:iron complex outermembrane receptor protein